MKKKKENATQCEFLGGEITISVGEMRYQKVSAKETERSLIRLSLRRELHSKNICFSRSRSERHESRAFFFFYFTLREDWKNRRRARDFERSSSEDQVFYIFLWNFSQRKSFFFVPLPPLSISLKIRFNIAIRRFVPFVCTRAVIRSLANSSPEIDRCASLT